METSLKNITFSVNVQFLTYQKKLWFISKGIDEKLFEKWVPNKIDNNNIGPNIRLKGFI